MITIKKYLLITIFFIFLTGCTKSNEKIGMIIEKNKTSAISIHYPITNIKKIDQKVQNYIQQTYQNFKKEEKQYLQSELNIDYTYFSNQELHNICLTIYTSNYKDLKKEKTECITYHTKTKKYLYLKDLIEQKDWMNFINTIKRKQNNQDFQQQIDSLSEKFSNFSLTNENLTIFMKNSEKTITLSFNLKEIPLKIEIKENKKKEEAISQQVDFLIDPTKPAIALTFDDGPTQYTQEILEILKKENVSATFFVLGNKVDMFEDTIQKIVKSGSEIGNHSYNHKWLSRLSTEEIKSQIDKTQEKIKNITGIYPRYLRPTYGSINNRIRNATDLNIVLWDIDPKDWKNQSPEKTVQRILDKIDDGKIVLLHDNHKKTVKAIQLLIPKLKEKGYQMVTLSDMEEIQILRKMN